MIFLKHHEVCEDYNSSTLSKLCLLEYKYKWCLRLGNVSGRITEQEQFSGIIVFVAKFKPTTRVSMKHRPGIKMHCIRGTNENHFHHI